MSARLRLLLLAGWFAGSAAALTAQEPFRYLHGTVVAAGGGNPVAGAAVRIRGRESGTAITNAGGSWRFGPVPPGEYAITVDRLGYASRSLTVQVAARGATNAIQIRLTPRALPLEAVVVTASRRPQRLKDVPVPTELVSRREIERTGAAGLAAVLTERVGILPQAGHPSGAGVMVQGLGSERVLVLVDGQPFIGRLSGRLDISRIPTSMIQRIEIVKGPQSVLYGSEAMGGVINVITRAAGSGEWRGGVDVTAGAQDRLDVTAHAAGGAGPLRFTADAGRRTVSAVPGRSADPDALARRSYGRARLRWYASPAWTFEIGGLLLDERQRWRSGQLWNFGDNLQWGARLTADWTRGPHALRTAVYASAFDHLERRGLGEDPPPETTGRRQVQRLIEAEASYAYRSGGHALTAGFEASREGITTERVDGVERTLTSVEPFVQYAWSAGGWTLAPGARLSWSEQWGTHWTPRVAVMVRPMTSLTVRGSLGRGYRAPSFKELYMRFLNIGPGFAYSVSGNTGLEPETSRSVAASVEWAADRVYVRGRAFRSTFENFIETRLVGDSSGVTLYSYGNVGRGLTRGFELEAGATWLGLRAEAAYGYLDTRNEISGESLLGRPANTGRLMVGYALPFGLRASVTGLYTGATPVQRTETGVAERGAFLRFDSRLSQELPHGFELAVGMDNILDSRPDRWPGYAGRHAYIRLGWEVQ